MTPELGIIGDRDDAAAALPVHRLTLSAVEGDITETGLGDLRLSAGRRLWSGAQGRVRLGARAAVKLANGDEDRGLGTGGVDVSAAVTASASTGNWTLTGLFGYLVVGEPDGVEYDNALLYGLGANRRFDRDSVFVTLAGQRATVPGGDDPLEAGLGYFRILSTRFVFTAQLTAGLSDASPDAGVSAGLVRWFD